MPDQTKVPTSSIDLDMSSMSLNSSHEHMEMDPTEVALAYGTNGLLSTTNNSGKGKALAKIAVVEPLPKLDDEDGGDGSDDEIWGWRDDSYDVGGDDEGEEMWEWLGDNADEGEGVSGMNENDDDNEGNVDEGEGERVSGMNENDEGGGVSGMNENDEIGDDDDEDIVEDMDWSNQVALEHGSWEHCPELYTPGTGHIITITDQAPDTPPHITPTTNHAAPPVFRSTDVRLRTTQPTTTNPLTTQTNPQVTPAAPTPQSGNNTTSRTTAALTHTQPPPTMSTQKQGELSTPAGATKRTHINTSQPTHTRRILLPNPVPTTSQQPRPRPYLLQRPPPRTHSTAPTPPSAMFWWCWDDQCGRANPLNTHFCGYCGCARSFRRYGC